MKIYNDQRMLMARLLANPSDFVVALQIGINEDTWEQEDLVAMWEAMMETRHKDELHELMAFYFNCNKDHRDALVELATCPNEIRYSTVNIEWQVMKATGKTK